MKQYILPILLTACANQIPITTSTQPTTQSIPNTSYQKVPEIKHINHQYVTLKDSIAEIIVLSAIDQNVFNTTCITGDQLDIGRLMLIKNPCNTQSIEEILQITLPKIDQDNNLFLTQDEVKTYSQTIIQRHCTTTSQNAN